MKKLLILGMLLGAVPLLLRADVVNTAPSGATGVAQTGPSGTSPAPRKAKKRHSKKIVAQTIALFVTDEGFVPAGISVKKGVPVHLVVTRQTDGTCATSIVIPDYGLSRDLPLNAPVTLSFTPKVAGQIRYSCGMGMIQGALTVD